ncbi:MAG: ABC transporter substrate-binding protein [Euryarchaeota archaeon]|nr:ABC transporter substrate-binding protein [Euryarchaeota archaeon]
MKIRVAHSPDPDDAFMFYALVKGKVESEFEFVDVTMDIETLNRRALEGEYEVTAISIHAYPYLAERYALLSCGASMGDGYGPVVVARERLESLKGRRVAIPGKLTSAYLALKLYEPEFSPVEVTFDLIPQAVARGEVDAGLLIHEGQLTYSELELVKLVDLGEWWREETSLPLPLGGNAIRRDLGEEVMRRVATCLRESILYALEHEEEALKYAMRFARGLDWEKNRRFVRMYVNEYTLDYGERGREAVRLFLKRGFEAGVLPRYVEPEFIAPPPRTL